MSSPSVEHVRVFDKELLFLEVVVGSDRNVMTIVISKQSSELQVEVPQSPSHHPTLNLCPFDFQVGIPLHHVSSSKRSQYKIIRSIPKCSCLGILETWEEDSGKESMGYG